MMMDKLTIIELSTIFVVACITGYVDLTNYPEEPTPAYVKPGEDAVLTCLYRERLLDWYKTNSYSYSKIVAGSSTINASKYSSSTPGLLVIYNTLMSDLTTYICQRSDGRMFYLQLHFRATTSPSEVYGKEGFDVLLECKGLYRDRSWNRMYSNGSISKYSIENRLNNVTLSADVYNRLMLSISTSLEEYNLIIKNFIKSDEGHYMCSGKLPDSTLATRDVVLYLIVAPSSVRIQNVSNMSRLTGSEGHDLTVACSSSGGAPGPNVTLLIDDTSLATNIQTVKYVLGSISRHYDQQTITCESSNDANIDNPIRTTALIYLTLKPSTPVISPDVVGTTETKLLTAVCSSNGSRPSATLFWFIGNINVTSSSTLQFVHVPSDDTYTATSTLTYSVDRSHNNKTIICTAVNIATSMGLSTSKQLDIKFAPSVKVSNVTYNQSITERAITCKPNGNPSKYIHQKWEHRSIYGQLIRELDANGHNILTLPFVPEAKRYQDNGVYVCTVSNGIVGSDGNIEQMGLGFLTIYAEPVLTNNNSGYTHYAEIGKYTEIQVNVYSVPKYNIPRWYRNNVQIISSPKYLTSDVQTMVTDNFHGTDVDLDGYRLTLTIKDLANSDFNMSYSLQLSNGIGGTKDYVVFLQSASAPQTPLNVTILRSTDTSIIVKWISGYDGGIDQTFYIQYQLRDESESWITIPIPEKHIQPDGFFSLYTLSGLQSKTVYLLRLYSENAYSRSLYSAAVTAQTVTKDNPSDAAVIGGVLGALCAILSVAFITFIYFKRKRGYLCRKAQKFNKRENKNVSGNHSDVFYQNQVSLYDEVDDSPNTQTTKGGKERRNDLTFQEYETIATPDKPNEYDELTHTDNRKDETNKQTKTKEMYRRDNVDEQPHGYLELVELDKKQKDQSETGVQYESLGLRDKPTLYEKLTNKEREDKHELSSAQYESLGDQDKPGVYEKLTSSQDKDKQIRAAEQYETLGIGDKPNVYDYLSNKKCKSVSLGLVYM